MNCARFAESEFNCIVGCIQQSSNESFSQAAPFTVRMHHHSADLTNLIVGITIVQHTRAGGYDLALFFQYEPDDVIAVDPAFDPLIVVKLRDGVVVTIVAFEEVDDTGYVGFFNMPRR